MLKSAGSSLFRLGSRAWSRRAFSASSASLTEKKRGQFVSVSGDQGLPKVKLYPGFQKSVEEKKFDKTPSQDEVYAKKVIEDFYGLNQLEYDKQEEEAEIDEETEPSSKKEFNLEEALKLLKEENVQDICCIEIPKDANYADFLVVGSCLSDRHLNSTFISFYRSYKTYQHESRKELPRSSSKETKWCAMDLGRIVVHLFLPEYREFYDLESLWTCGSEFDDKLGEYKSQREALEKKFAYAEVDDNLLEFQDSKP